MGDPRRAVQSHGLVSEQGPTSIRSASGSSGRRAGRGGVAVSGAGPRPAPASGHVRYLLGALLAFGALNAFGGGYYGLSGADGIPTEWLQGSPFSDYLVPS